MSPPKTAPAETQPTDAPRLPEVEFLNHDFEGEEAKTAFQMPLQDAHCERVQTLRRIIASKKLFDSCKFSLTLTARNGTSTSVYKMNFPHYTAQYAEASDPSPEESVNARFYLENSKHVVTRIDHLPTIKEVRQMATDFMSERVCVDDMEDSARVFGRPQMNKPPEPGEKTSLLMEAELDDPVSFNDKTKFVILVHGHEGTRGEVYESDPFTGKQLMECAHHEMSDRKEMLKVMKRVVDDAAPGSEVRVSPHPLLFARFCFCFRTNGNICGDVIEGKDLNLPQNKCALATFRLVWTTSGSGHRRLAIASAVVGFSFDRPTNDAQTLDECAVCLENIDAGEGDECPQCKKRVHSDCLLAWFQMCHRDNCATTCPNCRLQR